MKRNYWTIEEEEYLKEFHPNLTTNDLSKNLNRSNSSISKKLFSLGLKKSKEHKSKMIGKRNKMVGRDLTYDLVKDIALKYKTRGEFQQHDSSVYNCARLMGCLNDVCSHMFKNQYSMPQLILSEILKIIIKEDMIYDTRKIIKPYELDIFIPRYNLAFEYDGKGWHKNNENDEIKNNKCIEKNIKLIRIIENNRKYTSDIKSQLINKLDEINNHCNLNIKEVDISNINIQKIYDNINQDLLDIDDVKKIISKYTDYRIFMKNEPNLYQKLKRMKRLEEFTKDLKKYVIIWDEEKIKKEISKYEYLMDFIKYSPSCYLYVKRHKLDYMTNKLKRNNNVWNIDKIKKIILKNNVKKITDLKRIYPGSISFLRKNNSTQKIKNYIKTI